MLHGQRRLTAQEEKELGERVQQGDEDAVNTLVEHNIPLVVYLAKKNCWMSPAQREDLVQEGCLRLIEAARKFDPSRGKFSTYAAWYIEQGFIDATYRGNTVTVPRRRMSKEVVDYERLSKPEVRELPDTRPGPREIVQEAETRQLVRTVLNKLPEKHRAVLVLRFVEEMTMEMAGRKLGLSRQRIEQIQREALLTCRKLAG